ncbi:MAG: hypothetical protein IPN95_31655 [Bacteroidetes bacterium]|nr:hypothetical protein [Bacteroidota bacterium]MBP6720991.1 hypothetical protein [Bacteroidia bacterium]
MKQFESDWTQFQELTPFLETGEVEYFADTSTKFSRIAKLFPILAYRINWMEVENVFLIVKRSENVFESATSGFIKKVFEVLGIEKHDKLDALFDGITEGGLTISAGILSELGFTFLLIAQHTYIIPDDCRWCINYTFEGQLHFGFAAGGQLETLERLEKELATAGIEAQLRLRK